MRRQSLCATSLSSATSTVNFEAPLGASAMAELQRGRAFGRERDREMERRTMPDGALHPDLASVHLHDLLNDREAEASPGYGLSGATAHAPEALEDVADLLCRDADPGVGDAYQRVPSLHAAGQRDRPAFG